MALAILSIALLALAVIVAWVLARDLVLAAGAQSWKAVDATLYQQREGWQVIYPWLRYEVDGTQFQSGRWYWLQAFDWRAIRGLKAESDRDRQGETIAIRYHPRAPQLAIPTSAITVNPGNCFLAILVIATALLGAWGASHQLPPPPLPAELLQLPPEIRDQLSLAELQQMYPEAFPPISLFTLILGPLLIPLRLALLLLLAWIAWDAYQTFAGFGKAVHWPMHSAKIHGDTVRIAADGLSRPRPFRDIQYSYRADDHRFEADRLTAFGTALDTGSLPVDLPFPEGVDLGAVVPCWHRPGRPGQSMLLNDPALLRPAILHRVLRIALRLAVVVAAAESVQFGRF